MEFRTLGDSGCGVSSLGLGTMTFGAETDEPVAHRQLDRFAEAGGTLVDTADVYGGGMSEEIIGRWLARRPAAVTAPVVLAPKGRVGLDNSPHGSRKSTGPPRSRSTACGCVRWGGRWRPPRRTRGWGCCPGARSAAAGCRGSTSALSARLVLPAWARTQTAAWRPTAGGARRAPGRSSTRCRRWPANVVCRWPRSPWPG